MKYLKGQNPDELDRACVSEFCHWIAEQNTNLIYDLIRYAKKAHSFKPKTSLSFSITAAHADEEDWGVRTIARLHELAYSTNDYGRFMAAIEHKGSMQELRRRVNAKQAAMILGMPERTFRHKVSQGDLGEILGRSKEPGRSAAYDTMRVVDYAIRQTLD
jgi:hypothetical protein